MISRGNGFAEAHGGRSGDQGRDERIEHVVRRRAPGPVLLGEREPVSGSLGKIAHEPGPNLRSLGALVAARGEAPYVEGGRGVNFDEAAAAPPVDGFARGRGLREQADGSHGGYRDQVRRDAERPSTQRLPHELIRSSKPKLWNVCGGPDRLCRVGRNGSREGRGPAEGGVDADLVCTPEQLMQVGVRRAQRE